MFQFMQKWLGKEPQKVTIQRKSILGIPKSDIPTFPQSHPYPNVPWSLIQSTEDFSLPTGVDPRILFPLLQKIRDYIPDVSAGVWSWVRLCSTPLSYLLQNGDESEQSYAKGILQNLDRRIYGFLSEQDRGIESLVQCYFLSVFTYGAFCGEIILDRQRNQIDRFIIIDPATIRFTLNKHTREFSPHQILQDGSLVSLNPASFFYFGLDTDGLSPYGRSPLLALPLVVKLQQQLLNDMVKAQHNAGYPTIHFKVTTPERFPRENINDYHERMKNDLDSICNEIEGKEVDNNFITYDNVTVHYIGPNGNAHQWSESIQAIGEQVISALHLAPFMIGRNWGTTESWGTAQYQLLTNNARTVQEGAKKLADWLCNLELSLQGLNVVVNHQFAPHHHLDVLDRARAMKLSVETLISLQEKGLIEADQLKQQLDSHLRFF